MSDHASTSHEAPAAAAPAAEGSNIVQQVLWVLAVLFLILAVWRTVIEVNSDYSKKSSTSFIERFDDWWTEKTSPALGQPANYEVLYTHEIKPGEVWATEKLTGKMTIDADGHKFAVQFSGCDEFTEFNGKQSSFPSCAKAGPALIKMGSNETKSFLIQIIRKK